MRTCFYGLFICLMPSLAGMAQNIFKDYNESISGTSITFRMVAIQPGVFTMGSQPDERQQDPDEVPPHEVALSAFWMEEHEVTFEEWDAFFKDVTIPQGKNVDGITRPTPQYIDLTWGMGRDTRQPTNSMSQQAAMMYCQWLYHKTGHFYRLPTEAEWEYACRAGGTSNPDPTGLQEVAFFRDNSNGKFHKIKLKKPNAWGLYDMLGNLSEWTLDQYDVAWYAKSTAKDPLVSPASKYPRATRGGSYLDEAKELRCANRIPSDAKWNQRDPQIPKSRWWLTDAMFVGFRVVRPLKEPSEAEIEKFYSLYLK